MVVFHSRGFAACQARSIPLPSCQLLPLYQLPFSANKLGPVLLFQTRLGLRAALSPAGPPPSATHRAALLGGWASPSPRNPFISLGFHEEICPPGNGLHIPGTLLRCPFRLCGACGGLFFPSTLRPSVLQHPRPALHGRFAPHSCSPATRLPGRKHQTLPLSVNL